MFPLYPNKIANTISARFLRSLGKILRRTAPPSDITTFITCDFLYGATTSLPSPSSLLTSLHTLYAIPPARSDAPPAGDTDLARLARAVAIYVPAALPADSPASSRPADGANAINTYRDKKAPQPSSALLNKSLAHCSFLGHCHNYHLRLLVWSDDLALVSIVPKQYRQEYFSYDHIASKLSVLGKKSTKDWHARPRFYRCGAGLL